MALLRNGKNLYANPGVYTGPGTNETGNWIKGGLRNRYAGGLNNRFSAYPNGALHPGAFIMPLKAGSIASYNYSTGNIGGNNPALIRGQPMLASGSGSITVTASQLDQIVSAIVNATGSISVTSAQLAAAASMAVNASGSITLTPANLGAIISVICNSSGAISPSLTFSALGFIECDIGGPTPLSPEGLAQAVWNELLVNRTTDGTFGKRIQELLTKNQFLGLK